MERADPQPHILYVTGPLREQLYRRFVALFDGRDDVEVRLDRRFCERRTRERGPDDGERRAGERRAGERRCSAPNWIVPPCERV